MRTSQVGNEESTPAPRPGSSARRRAWRSRLAALAILLAGIVIGSVGTMLLIRRAVLRHQRRPELIVTRATRHLRRSLRLTEPQEQKVEAIVSERIEAIRKIRDDALPRVGEQFQLLEREIAAELNEEQREKWRRQVARLERRLPVLARMATNSAGRIEQDAPGR